MSEAVRQRLTTIKARCGAATAGEWYTTHGHIENRDGESVTLFHWPNALFIANAKQDIPAMVTLIEVLLAEREAANEYILRLRQIMYSRKPETVAEARAALDDLASKRQDGRDNAEDALVDFASEQPR
jgi:hypothetical protein